MVCGWKLVACKSKHQDGSMGHRERLRSSQAVKETEEPCRRSWLGFGYALKSKPQPTSSSRLFLFSKYHPKEAVRRFFTRYCSGPATTTDYYYDSPSYEPGVVAKLIAPSFYSRVFVGEPLRTKKDREESAAKVFCEDPQVIEAVKKLPPSKNASSCRVVLPRSTHPL